jgi:hypothetical protein
MNSTREKKRGREKGEKKNEMLVNIKRSEGKQIVH